MTAPPLPPSRSLSRVAIAVRTVVATVLVVLAGALPVRVIAATFDPFEAYPGHTANYGVTRPRAIRAALPAIADESENTALVLGSSGIARAFIPAVFDAALARQGRQYVSYNLAQMLLQPETALGMANTIRQTYEARDKRVGLLVFGISVADLTRDGLRAARRRMPDQAFAFESASTLALRAPTEPLDAIRDGLELAFFGNVRPERVGLWIEDELAAHPVGCDSGLKQPPDTAEGETQLEAYCIELHRQFPRGVPPWNPETHGALDFGLPGTRPMLARMIELQPVPPAPPPPDASRKAPNDLDDSAIPVLVDAVRELKAVSDEVIILRDILNPAIVAGLPAEQTARWRAVATRIAHESDSPLIDLNDGTFTAGEFGDRTHLHALAAERFSEVLAERVRPLVQENHASR